VISALVVVGLACVALAYVAVPLRDDRAEPRADDSDDAAELVGRKRAALVAILDMEDERDAGKLSNADFAALRTEYEAEAATALVELDALRASGRPVEESLEAEIAAIRARLEKESPRGD
jgi:hypothetical protein